jgi:hypothetical protein
MHVQFHVLYMYILYCATTVIPQNICTGTVNRVIIVFLKVKKVRLT